MTKFKTKHKAHALRKTGAAALIIAAVLTLALLFTACPNNAGGGGTPSTPKHAVTFSVEGGNGMLKAEVDGTEINSGDKVEQGKTIVFTATPDSGFHVKGWTLDGKPVAEAGINTEYKLTVTKPAIVKVSFESNSTTPPPPTKYTVTLNQTEHGKVKASPAIPQDGKVDENTVITFTAKADDGYKVDKWTVTPAEALQTGTGADESETAEVKITADTTVSVSFIKKTYAITFSVEGGIGGTLEAKVDGKEISSGDMVEHGKEVNFTPKAEKGYRLKNWTLDGENIGGTAYFTLGVSKPATVTVSFEVTSVRGGAVLILSPDKLNIKVKAKTADGSAITVEGCNEETLASNTETTLTATGTTVILKGKITELDVSGAYGNKQPLVALNVQGLIYLQTLGCEYNQLTELNVEGCTSLKGLGCGDNKLTSLNLRGLTSLQTLFCGSNQLTSLNVQDLTALQRLYCPGNQLNAQAMTKLLKGLPVRAASDDARAVLYTEETDKTEGNCKDFTNPPELKAAFDEAKTNKHWKLQKIDASESNVDL